MNDSVEGGGQQAPGHAPAGPRAVAGWAAGWAAVVALAWWTSALTPGWLAASAVLALAWALLAREAGRAWRMAASVAFLAALSIGAGVQFRLYQVAADWEHVRASAEEKAAGDLREGLDDLLQRAEAAVSGAASAAQATRARPGAPAPPALFTRLAEMRADAGVSALAVYGPDGSPLAWSGEHRGNVPEAVRTGQAEYSFSSGPLFGYVYFTRRFAGGRTAVAAVLLEAHVAVGEGGRPFADRFTQTHGLTPRFTTPDRAQGASVWDWSLGKPILSVVFATLTQERWRDRVAERGRWAVGIAWLAAALLVCGAWFRTRRTPGVPVIAGTAALLALPLGSMAGAEGVFSPLRFVLPLPGDVNLGQLFIVLCGVAVWVLSRSRPGRLMARIPLLVRTAAAAAALAGAAWIVRASVAEGVLAEHAAGGVGLVLAMTLLASLPLLALLSRSPREVPRRERVELVAFGLVLAALLGIALVFWWRPGRDLPFWTAALWAIPFGVVAAVLPRSQVGRGALLPWIAAGWIAGSMSLSHLWVLHLEARLDQAEQELSRLGTRADPFLDFLLRQFAEKALFYSAEGREGVSLLYQAWVEGGLAKEGYEARITLWDGRTPSAELRLSDSQIPPELVPGMLASARAAEEPIVQRYTELDELHYLLVVPLPGGRTISVAVPPRRSLGRSTALARFLDPGGDSDPEGGITSLSLVTAPPGPRALPEGGMRWIATRDGWRSEAVVEFPSGPMHAHLLVQTPSRTMLLVHGLLGEFGIVVVMALLWSLARTLCGEPFGVDPGGWGWLWSFRGRLTLALFAFFLLPMAAFGATTYQALSREVVRTASALAQRALGQAAGEMQSAPLEQLGPLVGSDLLLYHRGVLVEGTSPEVIDLGLYHTWLPARVQLDFSVAEGTAEEEERKLAGHRYLVSYRRLGASDVLAAPVPLASAEISRRQHELASVVLLASLAGAALSVVLALLVGRAFSRPIEGLSRAAAAVGAGDLSVRLPARRRDEFGGLFRSFNRMVRGLRQARGDLERETERTEAIVSEAGTGVLALDSAGRIALINRRACQIMGVELEAGQRIPRDLPMPAVVAEAVSAFLASGAREWADEREVDDRVVRMRLRRLPVPVSDRGAVLVLEDVTAEIRSARVLAWGEMARQVAHEIKNPLTPIKLAVQHIRRAHADRRDDFGAILDRNVDAVLREIDRLGEIARAFARFGTPSDSAQPPEPVDVGPVANETLALYRGGQDGIAYRVEVEPSTPRAFARVGELKEVLVNVLENARAALPEGGEVAISARPVGGGAWVQLDVADTGEGIPADLLPRVFEPQFSTRTSGTGLGLAIVRRLVESWGGEVTVDSEPGAGTTVHVRLRSENAWAAMQLTDENDRPKTGL